MTATPDGPHIEWLPRSEQAVYRGHGREARVLLSHLRGGRWVYWVILVELSAGMITRDLTLAQADALARQYVLTGATTLETEGTDDDLATDTEG